MVDVNVMKVFGECFQEDAAAMVMARVLSRQPEVVRERVIHELAMTTGIHKKFWAEKMKGLGPKKK